MKDRGCPIEILFISADHSQDEMESYFEMKQKSGNACKGCPKGRYGNQLGLTLENNCKACEIGRYSGDSIGIQLCKQCQSGRPIDRP